MSQYVLYTLTVGELDYAATSFEEYGKLKAAREYLAAVKKDAERNDGKNICEKKLQRRWFNADDNSFQITNFNKFCFQTKNDRDTAIECISNVLTSTLSYDALKETNTYSFTAEKLE